MDHPRLAAMLRLHLLDQGRTMTITRAQALLLKAAEDEGVNKLEADDREGHADVARLVSQGYAESCRLISGEVSYFPTQLGLAALIDWKRCQGPKGWARCFWTWARKEYKWFFGVIALPSIFWLLNWLFG